MSATYYTPGQLYSVGTNPALKLLNVRNTRTFSEFIVRGASAGPVLPGQKLRLRNYPDTAGPEVYPYGRATGQPGLSPVTAPPADPCSPVWDGVTWPTACGTLSDGAPCFVPSSLPGDWQTPSHRILTGDFLAWDFTGMISYTTPADGAYYGMTYINPIQLGQGTFESGGCYTNAGATPMVMLFGYLPVMGSSLTIGAGGYLRMKLNGMTFLDWGEGVHAPSGYAALTTLPAVAVGQSVPIRITIEVNFTSGSSGAMFVCLIKNP